MTDDTPTEPPQVPRQITTQQLEPWARGASGQKLHSSKELNCWTEPCEASAVACLSIRKGSLDGGQQTTTGSIKP